MSIFSVLVVGRLWVINIAVVATGSRVFGVEFRMDNQFAEVPAEAWDKAATRLNGVGVFADEDRQFPSFPALRHQGADFEAMLRSKGYVGGVLGLDELDEPKDDVTFLVFDSAKIEDISAALPVWEQDHRDRLRADVHRRLANWIQNLNSLRKAMQDWLPKDKAMSIVDRRPTLLHSDMMRKFRIPPMEMPTFEIRHDSNRIMLVHPKSPWVIGAKGRIDLITPNASYILVDQSPEMSEATDWRYYAGPNKRDAMPLDELHFVGLLN